MFWFPRSRRVGKKPPPPPFFSTTTKRKEKARGALTHDHHAPPPPPPLKEASPCLLAMRTTRFESCRQCLSFLSRRRDVFVSWEKSKKKKPKTLNYLSLHREGNIFLCVFFKTTTPLFFFWTRRETLQTKHLSLCLVIYIKTLCCAFVRRAFAETNKERERERKKKRVFLHTHTHTLSLGGRGGGGEGGAFVSSSFESLLLLRSVWKYLSSFPKRCCILNDHLLNHYSLRKHSSRRLPKV